MDNHFKFTWNLDSDRIIPFNEKLDGSRILWRSKETDFDGSSDEILLFGGGVEVFNPNDLDNQPATESFVIKIKNRR